MQNQGNVADEIVFIYRFTAGAPCFGFIEMFYASIMRIWKESVSQIATWTVKRYITCPVGMSAKLKTAQKNKELVIELIADAIYVKLSTSYQILMSASVSTKVKVKGVTYWFLP